MAPCIGTCGYYKLKLNNETWATDSPETKSLCFIKVNHLRIATIVAICLGIRAKRE
jgi:hypothetical protein